MSVVTELQRLQTAKANLKTAIEAKGVVVGADTIDTYPDKVDDVYSVGYEKGKSEGGGMMMANYASKIQFTSDDWATSDTVVLDMPNLSTMDTVFSNLNFRKIKHLTINSDTPITTCLFAFRGISDETECILETVVLNVDTSIATNWNNMFFKKHSLKRVEGVPLDFSGATAIAPFAYTYNVEHFRVAPNSIKINANFNHCASIDDDTIQSIIDGLADLTDGTAQTLTLHADIKTGLTEEQLATITGKNWTLA